MKTEAGPAPQIVRLRDIARVASASRTQQLCECHRPQIRTGGNFSPSPEANVIRCGGQNLQGHGRDEQQFPGGLRYMIRFDTTTFVREAISGVYETLFIAGALVLVVILLFLQSLRPCWSRHHLVPSPSSGPLSPWSARLTVNLRPFSA